MRESRSHDPIRLTLQLMLGFLASFMLWLIGLCLEEKGMHRDFQANSIKHKGVLSLIFLVLEAALYMTKKTSHARAGGQPFLVWH